jgi:hypothetical protein
MYAACTYFSNFPVFWKDQRTRFYKGFYTSRKSFSDVAGLDKVYRFSNFTNGHVYFRDGTMSAAKLNYNFLNKEIEFISPGSDTLAIVKEQALNIKNIIIDSITFYYYDGYLEEMAHNEDGKLLKRQFYQIKGSEKIGAYNLASTSSAIDSYSSYTDQNGQSRTLTVRENLTLVIATEYFFGDKYTVVLRATKKNMLDLYPKKKAQIESYLRNNNVNFTNGTDLLKLFSSL